MSPLASWLVFGGVIVAAVAIGWVLFAPSMYPMDVLADQDPLDPDLDAEDFTEWERECEEDRRERRREFFA